MRDVSTRLLRLAWLAGLAVALPFAPALRAQNPTGMVIGQVTDGQGAPLGSVLVTASSPSMQGERTTTTESNGNYRLALLPAGTYTITYSADGFATATREVRVNAAQTATSDVAIELATVTEEIVVTAVDESVSTSQEGSTSVPQDELEKLPVARNIAQAMRLAPGVADTGPSTEPSIAGAMSFENLYLVNGVVINENVRGQLLPLFIEDAIQETTTTVTSVTAEYGRFTGGVVNALTKSGGNEFSGSFRTNFINDDWEAKIKANEPHFSGSGDRIDEINEVFEATLGGFLWKDHVWFFGAGRDFETQSTDQTNITNITFPTSNEERRLEGKLTLTPVPNHSLIGSYLEIEETTTNSGFQNFIDLASLSNREDPQEIISGNYTGILTNDFFVEAQYSEREFIIGKGSGGPRDQIFGTMLRDRGSSIRYFAPTFCGFCEDTLRNNENLLAKGSYFLSTDNLGTHDIAFGYDTFEDIVFSINHQTGSDFTVWAAQTLIPESGVPVPVFNSRTWVGWFAVFNEDLARPTSFKTNSFFVNDSWQLNDHWSFNLGVRYDENDGQNSAGATVADDSKISPRLGATYDLRGDGDLVLHGSYGTYVAALLNSGNVADSTSNGGAIGSFLSTYGGPPVNSPGCLAAGNCVQTADALRILFDWYFNNGGTTDLNDDLSQIPNLISVSIPGTTAVVPDTFSSPSADEYVIGAIKRLGNKGLVRSDLVYRQWEDFYSNEVSLRTGQVDTPAGPTDLSHVGNFGDSVLEREYIGLHNQARYRFTDRFTLAANYTLSRTEGNINGETGANGPVPSSPFVYPEYQDNSWAFPVGDLATDQRHAARAWAIYDLFSTEHHTLSVSWLENFFSGTPYGAVGTVASVNFVTNPGYVNPPDTVTYFFTDRDAFRTDDIHRSDLALNYSFDFSAFGQDFEVFLQPEVLNVFNEDAESVVNTVIRTEANGGTCPDAGGPGIAGDCLAFNPFTETPVEGVHWAKGEDFGHATGEAGFQAPRLYRFSVGFRF